MRRSALLIGIVVASVASAQESSARLRDREAVTFNEIEREIAEARGLKFVDISGIANLVAEDQTLVATDGLHPSGRQYAAWVELIAPVVQDLFSR